MLRRVFAGISDTDLMELDLLSEAQHVPRAELIRQAVSLYLEKSKPAVSADEAFGLWRERKLDGLAYPSSLREEW